jgi:hypothetical protein
VHAHLWARHIDKGFTGPRQFLTLTPWFIAVKVVNISFTRNTSQPVSCKPYRSLGPFLHGVWIFIALDKFTKWIESKPTSSITVAKAVEFISKIMYQFDVPNNIITDNGTRFTARKFKDFCDDPGIKVNYASISHPQSNKQVERCDGMILHGLKPRIFYRLNVTFLPLTRLVSCNQGKYGMSLLK